MPCNTVCSSVYAAAQHNRTITIHTIRWDRKRYATMIQARCMNTANCRACSCDDGRNVHLETAYGRLQEMLPQDPQRLKDMWDCLQKIEYGPMCGTYLLEFNEASQRWESDLKCHTVHRKVEMGAKMKQSAVDGRQRKHASKHNATFSRLLGCAQGWESKWAALCKQHQEQMAQ